MQSHNSSASLEHSPNDCGLGAAIADSLLELDPEERRKRLQSEQRMLRTQIQTKLCHTIPASIEQHIKRGDQLVALGYEYLKNPSKVKARLRAERQKRLQAKLFIWAVVFAAIGLLLLVSMASGWIDGSGVLAFLVGTLGLAFLAFENVRRDFG